MKKWFLSFLILLVTGYSALAADPISNKLTEIERSYFGNSYDRENVSQRLSRLETSIYGAATNKAPQARVDKIYKDLNLGASPPAPIATNPAPTVNQIEDIGPKAEAGIKYPIVDKLEMKTFKKSYPNDDIYVRLSRLEKQVLKKESTDSLNERVSALSDKLLGGDLIAAQDVDTSTDEIILENGEKIMGGNETGKAASVDDRQYNYFSYEKSKNRIPDVGSSKTYEKNYDLDLLEKNLFGKKFESESPDTRLARLESQVLHRTFKDGEEARVQRLLAVTTAQKTSQEYDSNKWARRLNTGVQIGSILLMVLAMIL